MIRAEAEASCSATLPDGDSAPPAGPPLATVGEVSSGVPVRLVRCGLSDFFSATARAKPDPRGVQGTPQLSGPEPLILVLGFDPWVRPSVGGVDFRGDAVCVWCGAPVHPAARTCRDYHRERLSVARRRVRQLADDPGALAYFGRMPEAFLARWGAALACAVEGRDLSPGMAAGVVALGEGDWRGVAYCVAAGGLQDLLAALGVTR